MKLWFYIIVGLQVLFLVGEAVSNQIKLATGRTVILRTAPVDPRSLFMGNYMALSYDISSIDPRISAPGQAIPKLQPGAAVYVGLAKRGGIHEPVDVLTYLPPANEVDPTVVYLRGTVTGHWGQRTQVEYGLERYYIPETRQAEVNRLQWGRQPVRMTVEVAVASDGTGRIRHVLVGGKPLGF
jgi:uncharacterized membrane-anchored protein